MATLEDKGVASRLLRKVCVSVCLSVSVCLCVSLSAKVLDPLFCLLAHTASLVFLRFRNCLAVCCCENNLACRSREQELGEQELGEQAVGEQHTHLGSQTLRSGPQRQGCQHPGSQTQTA